ncbi:MAG: hypothetical protein HQ564_08820 [Candidatus Saganbacteria bacterium]|nr:hypothetical protein [Candidatus Saganbacteria bacterium]
MGRIFSAQHKRAVGLHLEWPFYFRNTLSKANDTHINAWTLKRHFKSEKEAIRNAAANNALSRKMTTVDDIPIIRNLALIEGILIGNFSDSIKSQALEIISKGKDGTKKAFFCRFATQATEKIEQAHSLWIATHAEELEEKEDEICFVGGETYNSERQLTDNVVEIYDEKHWIEQPHWIPRSKPTTTAYRVKGFLFVL